MVSVKQNLPKKVKPKILKNVHKVEKVKKPETVKKVQPKAKVIAEAIVSKKENTVKISETSCVPKKKKFKMPSKSITENLVNLSLEALQKLTIHNQKKNKILEDESPIFAEIRCMKIPNSKGQIKFVLPHSTAASTGEVCLITPDLKKGKKSDHEPTIDHWDEILRKADVTNVKTILPMRQLRVEYDQFELKRRLMTLHDFIMVDTRVLNHVSHLLGKMFFKKHNMLIPVRINEKGNIKKDIDTGLRTAMLRINEGHTSVIVVGHTSMPQEKVKENILSLVQQLHDRYPGGQANIRSISLKLPLSLSLPLYITLRSSNTVNTPKVIHKKPKTFTVLEDELSTRPGSTVRVAPDGTVHVKKTKKPEPDMSEMEYLEVDEDSAVEDSEKEDE